MALSNLNINMMHGHGLFSFVNSGSVEAGIQAEIALNAGHDIFEGHFPGQPVLPGVCMLQIVKEVLESQKKEKMMLVKADMMKFLSFINPVVNNMFRLELQVKGSGEQFKVEARLLDTETVFFKFKGTFIQFPA